MKDCPGCNTSNVDGAYHCAKCGGRLDGKVIAPPAASPATFAARSIPRIATAFEKYPALHLYRRCSEVLAWLVAVGALIYLGMGVYGLSQVEARAEAYFFLAGSAAGVLFLALSVLAGTQLIGVVTDMEGHLDAMRQQGN